MHPYSARPQQQWGAPANSHHGEPPFKRAKSGVPTPISITTEGKTVITKYAPPPGYQPPSRPQSPWTWSAPGYGQPQPFAGQQQPAYVPQSFVPQQQQQYTAAGFLKIQTSFPAAQQQRDWSSPYDNARSAPPVSAPWHSEHFTRSNSISYPPRHDSATLLGAAGPLLDGNGDVMPPMDRAFTDSLEHEFDSECYFARYPDEINQELSLGLIEWKAPMSAKLALPGTFKEAELEALAPRVDPLPGDCASEYFSFANRRASLLSVRQTKVWQEVKDQAIYRTLRAKCEDIISIPDLRKHYRAQYDKQWAEGSRPATPDLTREPTPAPSDSRPISRASNFSQATELDAPTGNMFHDRFKSVTPSAEPSVLDDLEQALQTDGRFPTRRPHSRAGSVAHSRAGSVASSQGPPAKHSRAGSVTHYRSGSVNHSRANSVSRHHGRSGSVQGHHRRQSSTNMVRPKPLLPVHDQQQEDILAALGVTGSAQVVYQTPGPAFGPRPLTAGSDRSTSRNNSVTSLNGASGSFLPPTIKEEIKEEDSEPDNDATPRPSKFMPANYNNSNVRKRSYADSVAGTHQYAEDEDATPKRAKSENFMH